MIKIITGNEPYKVREAILQLTETVNEVDFMEVTKLEDGMQFFFCIPFLSEKRVLLWNTEELKDELFEEQLEKINVYPDSTLVVRLEKPDKRTKLYKKLLKENLITECNKLSGKELKEFIKTDAKNNFASIDDKAIDVLLERTNYANDNDVNLYSIDNRIVQLSLVDEKITEEIVKMFLPEHIESTSYQLFSFISKGKIKDANKLINKLLEQKENPISFLSLLHRNYRICYKANFAGNNAAMLGLKEYQMKFIYDSDLNTKELLQCMSYIQKAIECLKNGHNKETVVYTLISLLEEIVENHYETQEA